MKSDLHPKYYLQSNVTCSSCGNKFVVGSTKPELNPDICSACHPFYTDKQRITSRGGRVDRFRKRYNLES